MEIGLGVEGPALRQQGRQACGGIVGLEQGARGRIAAEPLQQQLLRGIQPDHHTLMQLAPVVRARHHAAAGGHDQ